MNVVFPLFPKEKEAKSSLTALRVKKYKKFFF